MKANHKRAIQAGVKVALGTDAAVYPHGLNAHELDVYVNQYGMTPLAAIQSATLNAADLMGWTDRTWLDRRGQVGGFDRGRRRPVEGCAHPAACAVRDEVRRCLQG